MNELIYTAWPYGDPPYEWQRLLAVDVGGSTPWGWLWTAVDPWQNVIFYDEIYETTDKAPNLVELAKPRMVDPGSGEPYNFKAKVIDYENKIAAADLARMGIQMTNAQKHQKASSIERLKGYFHPNPRHHYPPWHPCAGQAGSPRAFVMARCRNLRRELPMARWLEVNGIAKNEMDRKTGNHMIDCALYTIRELPPPFELKPTPALFMAVTENTSKMSELYWHDERIEKERRRRAGVLTPAELQNELEKAQHKRLMRALKEQNVFGRIRTLAGLAKVN